ncbi:MAG: hypothetical protein ACI362_02825 [Coriobacteriales bacterium]
MTLGFYFDAESCIACHTCYVACKNVNHTAPGTNYRVVRSFCTGGDYDVAWYNVSMAQSGCTTCGNLRDLGEQPACVASCPMRVLEFGEIGELRAQYALLSARRYLHVSGRWENVLHVVSTMNGHVRFWGLAGNLWNDGCEVGPAYPSFPSVPSGLGYPTAFPPRSAPSRASILASPSGLVSR